MAAISQVGCFGSYVIGQVKQWHYQHCKLRERAHFPFYPFLISFFCSNLTYIPPCLYVGKLNNFIIAKQRHLIFPSPFLLHIILKKYLNAYISFAHSIYSLAHSIVCSHQMCWALFRSMKVEYMFSLTFFTFQIWLSIVAVSQPIHKM